jgi:glycosyltransferase involved in cell wall biosynthesis
MESMNYGLPCIVSASDGMPEIVDHEVNGIVIDKPTADLLANQIINLLNNPSVLASMSQAARDKVRTKLNWKTVAKNIVEKLFKSEYQGNIN